MRLRDYFETRKGAGVLSTADANGQVNSAIYARPHVADDGRIAFLMRERRSWHNVSENPNASYLFMEQGAPYSGIRLKLQMDCEEFDEKLILNMTRNWISPDEDAALGPKHLVYFNIESIRSLVGDEAPDLSWNLQ